MSILSTRRTTGRSLKARRSRQSLFHRQTCIERLEDRTLLASDFGSLPDFRNPLRQFDVNNDGRTTALDAMFIINDLNRNGPRVLSATSEIASIGGIGPSLTAPVRQRALSIPAATAALRRSMP